MARDRQLTKDFRLSEAPCWELATEEQIRKLQETSARVLQPLRNVFGTTYITSWLWWANGCEPRTGVHKEGGTVDIVLPGSTLEAWEWGNTYLMPTGYIGRWIYEPQTPRQGEHIHCAPRADMLAYNGDGRIQSLKELPNGEYWLAMEWAEGTYENPYELPPLEVVAEAGLHPLLSLLGIFLLLTFDFSSQATGGWTLKTP